MVSDPFWSLVECGWSGIDASAIGCLTPNSASIPGAFSGGSWRLQRRRTTRGGLRSAVTSDVTFCSPFDEALAHQGPAAVFLPDPEGALRFHANWTRDAWSRVDGPQQVDWRWVVMRDRDSGFVLLVLATSAQLLAAHPRFDVRLFEERDAAEAWLATFRSEGEGRDGPPPAVVTEDAFRAEAT